MKNLKKVLMVSLLAVSTMGIVFAGGSKEDDKVVISILGYGDNASAEGQTFLRIIDAFQAENPDIIVEAEMLFDEAYHQKVTARLASGDIPDIACMASDARWGGAWREANQFADISSYLDPSVYDVSKFGGTDGPNGEYYYVPIGTGNYCSVMFTNNELIKELGFDIPKTYDDLVAMVPAARKAGIEVMTTHGSSAWVWGSCFLSTIFAQTSGEADWPKKLAEGKVKITDPAGIAGLEVLETMVNDGVISSETVLLDVGTAVSKFNQGQALVFVSGQWDAGNIDINLQETMGMEPLPLFPGAKGQENTLAATKSMGYGITRSAMEAGKADICMDFINYFNSAIEVEQKLRDGAITGSVLANHVLPSDMPKIVTLKNDLGSRTTLTNVIDTFLTGAPNDTLITGAQEIISGRKTAKEIAEAVDAAM